MSCEDKKKQSDREVVKYHFDSWMAGFCVAGCLGGF